MIFPLLDIVKLVQKKDVIKLYHFDKTQMNLLKDHRIYIIL